MISKRTHPMIGKLSELLLSGTAVSHRAGFLDVAMTSPRGPLEYRIQSPRGFKGYDIGGVGLGIVAALERNGREIFPKHAICSYAGKSEPIPVIGAKETDPDLLEEYTYVTNHGPDKSFTKVYYDCGIAQSPPPMAAPAIPAAGEVFLYPTSDFLSACSLCKKKLQGKDIYMYRGEKGFCSNECRSTHIMNDERKEQCRSEIPRSADVSSTSPIFSTGILAI